MPTGGEIVASGIRQQHLDTELFGYEEICVAAVGGKGILFGLPFSPLCHHAIQRSSQTAIRRSQPMERLQIHFLVFY